MVSGSRRTSHDLSDKHLERGPADSIRIGQRARAPAASRSGHPTRSPPLPSPPSAPRPALPTMRRPSGQIDSPTKHGAAPKSIRSPSLVVPRRATCSRPPCRSAGRDRRTPDHPRHRHAYAGSPLFVSQLSSSELCSELAQTLPPLAAR